MNLTQFARKTAESLKKTGYATQTSKTKDGYILSFSEPEPVNSPKTKSGPRGKKVRTGLSPPIHSVTVYPVGRKFYAKIQVWLEGDIQLRSNPFAVLETYKNIAVDDAARDPEQSYYVPLTVQVMVLEQDKDSSEDPPEDRVCFATFLSQELIVTDAKYLMTQINEVTQQAIDIEEEYCKIRKKP
jgi:hypothetical protein